MFGLQDRVILLTGATGGIGRATARLLADAGAILVLSSDDAGACDALASEFIGENIPTHAIPADLADPMALHDLVSRATALAGPIDVLICNGGMEGHVGPLGEADEAAIDRLFAVNLRSAMTLTSLILPGMAERGQGSVVLVGSIAGVRGNKAIGLYGLAKAALAQLARNLAVEWGPSGVRINTLSPGLTDTAFARAITGDPDRLARRLSLTPLRRAGRPEEIAASILYLAGDASGFVTGHNLIVDGGTTISDGN